MSRALAWLLALTILAAPTLALAQSAPREIRVLLDEENTLQTISGEYAWSSEKGQLGTTRGEANVGLSGTAVVVRVDGEQQYARRLTAVPVSGAAGYNGREFRGRLEFFPGKAGGVVVLNVLPLEDYLAGVVAAEMPPSWPEAALRAQAIAARTYALSRMMAMADSTFDVASTTADQMYKGISGEDPRTTQAVHDTAGLIMTYQGHPIIAYFCSDAGGYTRQGSEPYLKAVPSLAVNSPHNDWSFELSHAELVELTAAAGTRIESITGIRTVHDPVSGHLESLTIAGGGQSCTFSGVQLRRYIGRSVMKSTRVRFEPLGDAEVTAGPAPAVQQEAQDIAPATGGDGYDTVTLEGYHRPWVANDERDWDLKLRSLYAYNGWDLEKCNRLVHVWRADPEPAPVMPGARPATGRTTAVEARGQLGGLIVRGSGYGHGMGMSQWGARQLAEDGYDYDVILDHFYTGVALIRWNGEVPEVPVPIDDESSNGFYQPFSRE